MGSNTCFRPVLVALSTGITYIVERLDFASYLLQENRDKRVVATGQCSGGDSEQQVVGPPKSGFVIL
jgi:hypothetical protein